MDFSQLDLRQAADKTYWVHLRFDETMLYADSKEKKPCRVEVASIAEPGVEEALKTVQRVGRLYANLEQQLASAPNRQTRQTVEKRLDSVNAEAERAFTAFIMKSVRNWENIEMNGKELPFSPEALEDMAQPNAPLARIASWLSEDMAAVQRPFTGAANG